MWKPGFEMEVIELYEVPARWYKENVIPHTFRMDCKLVGSALTSSIATMPRSPLNVGRPLQTQSKTRHPLKRFRNSFMP